MSSLKEVHPYLSMGFPYAGSHHGAARVVASQLPAQGLLPSGKIWTLLFCMAVSLACWGVIQRLVVPPGTHGIWVHHWVTAGVLTPHVLYQCSLVVYSICCQQNGGEKV